jgi:hypothetical protein
MAMNGPGESSAGGESDSTWEHVPQSLWYLKEWASKFGLRGLTVYFGKQPPLRKLASPEELVDLRAAYEEILRREDAPAISEWCLSIRPETPANDAKEHIRGLLLLFERLAERDLLPFTDGRVRFLHPKPRAFDWTVLPATLSHFEPWLRKFERLRTEHDLYEYVQYANETQLRELAELKRLLDSEGSALLEWCEAHISKGNLAEYEAFQAEWLFLLVDFAHSKIQKFPAS